MAHSSWLLLPWLRAGVAGGCFLVKSPQIRSDCQLGSLLLTAFAGADALSRLWPYVVCAVSFCWELDFALRWGEYGDG